MAGKKERRTDDQLRGILEAMRARKEKITVDTFIAAAGAGDRTFMTEFLAMWRREVEEREGAVLAVLPPRLTGVLNGLDLQLREVFGVELAVQADRFRIVDTELRAREAAAACVAARTIQDLTTKHASLLEEISCLSQKHQEAQQREGEHLRRIERLTEKLEQGESAAGRERDTFVAVLKRAESDVIDTREQLRGSDEALYRALQERDTLASALDERDAQLKRVNEMILELATRESVLQAEVEKLVAALNQLNRELEDARQLCCEEQAARADMARELRLCNERG